MDLAEGTGQGQRVAAQLSAGLVGIVEQRCLTSRNGATWQVETLHRLESADHLDRPAALREVVRHYVDLMHSNRPVHEWPIP